MRHRITFLLHGESGSDLEPPDVTTNGLTIDSAKAAKEHQFSIARDELPLQVYSVPGSLAAPFKMFEEV